jgi:tetratricopeptide (TPR) repeat protein
MAGIIQEQHPDRARLFMQWKQMQWPLLVDSLNLLGVDAVPITVAIDEHGIVRAKGIKPSEAESFVEEFVESSYATPDQLPAVPVKPDPEALRRSSHWAAYADALMLWQPEADRREAIAAYQRAIDDATEPAPLLFRQGVAYRARYDSRQRETGDFRAAVEHWQRALDLNPNQYIWRRRIQQYGPRLDKPYPFYDWVDQARQQVTQRGETPAALLVEPGGAEIASPAKELAERTEAVEPDPGGKIYRDEKPFVLIEQTVVPPVLRPGSIGRIHLVLYPNAEKQAHWNNEAGDLVVWLKPPQGWELETQRLTVPNPPEPVSMELRHIEFEVRVPESASEGDAELPAYALYYVCEDEHGVCLYRRQDISVRMPISR